MNMKWWKPFIFYQPEWGNNQNPKEMGHFVGKKPLDLGRVPPKWWDIPKYPKNFQQKSLCIHTKWNGAQVHYINIHDLCKQIKNDSILS